MIKTIKKLPGPSLVKKDEDDKSFLFLALENGSRKIANQLLDIHTEKNQGTIIFDNDSTGRSCLHLAACCDHFWGGQKANGYKPLSLSDNEEQDSSKQNDDDNEYII